MYLKNLTVRGFKSFASATTLRFEPGITCVVGPNGSGKSNVVDALAWVMGEQGAKSLRGGKMEDVIFAGTSSRAALGRAEVSLTIDNSDGALPIDYSEVTVRRTMFRNGGSEYAINGDTCRLLDLQELLSDSGIGREMHVIVGQGQLDTVLHAGPEERRGLIEEAAGILKHRKRKEKALRKLEAMQGNLDRVSDLTAELQRRLKPLGKQAELARRAATIQAELRDARLRLLADDIATLDEELTREAADEAALLRRREETERALAEAQERENRLDTAASQATPELQRAHDTYHGLSRLRERLTSVADLAAERHRNLVESTREVARRNGRDPETLEREAEQAQAQEEELRERLDEARLTLDKAAAERATAEEDVAAEEKRIEAAARAAADRREGLARLRGRRETVRSRIEAHEEEVERLTRAAHEAAERAETAKSEYERAAAEAEGLDADDTDLDAAHERAKHDLGAAEARLDEARQAERDAEREHAALAARKEALEMGLDRKDGAATLVAAGERLPGILGPVAELVEIEAGMETAVAAALDSAAEAVAVTDPDTARQAFDLLKGEDGGRAGIVVGAAPGHTPAAPVARPPLPEGQRYLTDLVTPHERLRDAVSTLLGPWVLVEGVDAAWRLLERHPELCAVTREGDVFTRALLRGGSAGAPSTLETRAAVEETTARMAEAVSAGERAAAARAAAEHERAEASGAVEEITDRRKAAEKRRNEVSQRLGTLSGQARAAEAEAERCTAAITTAAKARENDQAELAELERRLEEAEAEPGDEDPDTTTRDELAERARAARAAETEARLALRTAEERARSTAGRADELRHAAAEERRARERAERRRARRRRQAHVAKAVADGATEALARVETSLAAADTERAAAEEARAAREEERKVVRARVRELSVELEKLVTTVHSSEMARAERKLRLDQLRTKAVEEMGIDLETLAAEYGPRVPVPPPADAEEDAVPVPYVREVQEKRVRTAERELNRLGKVNPLALEEYAALQERHAYLASQLEDLKATRRDLQTVVKEVDERVQEVFGAAFTDVAREFAAIFGRLFPEGEGRLVLTDPNDMLTTGVDVEARPPGKKVKRLSLLSGGERSLTAVAFLAAIFRARPSPFYVLDEVEAALDDTNLQRLLVIFEELRANSQLIVITHQKRTMEAADALYGVTMQGDGISRVISQKLDRSESAPS